MSNEVYLKKKTGESILLNETSSHGNNYVRFANGLQICIVNISQTIETGTNSDGSAYTKYNNTAKWPVPFKDTSYYASCEFDGDSFISQGYIAKSKEKSYAKFSSGKDATKYKFIAIGFWK